jgi:thiol-disulfide isomerase/thioredoxin
MRFAVIFGVLLVAGCSTETPPPAKPAEQVAPVEKPVELPEQSEPVVEEPTTEAAPGEPAAAAPTANELKIDTLDWDQTLAIASAHPGKVVVLDLWATYCPPCLKELPGLVALQAKYPDKVHCVSVCLDFDGDPAIPPAKLEPEIRAVLESKKAHHVQNVLLSTGSDELLKRVKRGSMPIIFVYDQTGKQVHVFPDLDKMDEATYDEHITPAVEALLKSGSPSN